MFNSRLNRALIHQPNPQPKAMTTTANTMKNATKLAATIASIQENGVQKLADINRILKEVYPAESLTKSAIHTAQTLKAAGITTELATMQELLETEFSNGLKLGDKMIAQGLAYLLKESRKRDSLVSDWQADLLAEVGASLEWDNVYGHYDQRTGTLLYYVPTFRAYAADGSHILEYYITNGKLSVCG